MANIEHKLYLIATILGTSEIVLLAIYAFMHRGLGLLKPVVKEVFELIGLFFEEYFKMRRRIHEAKTDRSLPPGGTVAVNVDEVP